MSSSGSRVKRHLQEKAVIENWADVQKAVAELQRVHNNLAREHQFVKERVFAIDYRGPLGWFRKKRDIRRARKISAQQDEARRTALARLEAEQRKGEAGRAAPAVSGG